MNAQERELAELAEFDNTVSNIKGKEDTTPPKDAEITFDKESYKVGDTIVATVKLQDDESGVDVSASKYVINTNAGGITEEDIMTSFDGEDVRQTISYTPEKPGTYYLYVVTVDKNGNEKVTIKQVAVDTWTVSFSNGYSISACYGNNISSSFELQPGWSAEVKGYGVPGNADGGCFLEVQVGKTVLWHYEDRSVGGTVIKNSSDDAVIYTLHA